MNINEYFGLTDELTSKNIVWEGLEISGVCVVCGEPERWGIDAGQNSTMLKRLFPKMIEMEERKHIHKESHATKE